MPPDLPPSITPQKEKPKAMPKNMEPLTPITPTSSKGKARAPSVDISYILVLSRYPRWKGQVWSPKGRFSQKRLPQLMEELPPGFAATAPGLMFRLRGPGNFRTEEPIPHGEDDTFDFMQENFSVYVRRALRTSGGDRLSFRIEIEPLADDYLSAPGEYDEAMDGEHLF